MGVYDSGINFDFLFGFDKKKAIQAIGVLVVVLLFVGVAYWAVANYEPKTLRFDFQKNPIKSNEQTNVTIIITNNSSEDAQNVSLSLAVKEKTEFDIFPVNQKFNGKIPYISKGTSREITYTINPIGEVLPGSYTLVAKATFNGETYSEQQTLKVG